jgi:hypothetical protein
MSGEETVDQTTATMSEDIGLVGEEQSSTSTDDLDGFDALAAEVEAKAKELKEGEEAAQKTEGNADKEAEEDDDSPVLQSTEDKDQTSGEVTSSEPFKYDLPEWIKAMGDEGFDKAGYDEFESFAKENNISEALFGKLLNRYFENVQKVQEGFSTGAEEQLRRQNAAWKQELKSHPDIGGADYGKNISYAVKAIDMFGGSALSKVLKQAGIGSNPTVVQAFMKIGKALGEGEFVGGTPKPATAKKSLEDVFYDD